MSLIVAVHNASDIVIAWDRQSRYTQAGRTVVPPEEAKKVAKINDQLALMVTGSYNSDKLALLADFRQRQREASLDQAFTALYDLVLQQHSVIPEAASVMRFTGVGLAAASPA